MTTQEQEQRLREALQTAPSIPATPGVGSQIARQAARRRLRQRVGAGGVVAAVSLAVTVGVVALRSAPLSPPVTGPSSTPTGSQTEPPVGELSCFRPAEHPVQGAPVVPEGAVAARLCGGQIDNAGFNMVWPSDTLRGAYVNRLVDRLNNLSPYIQREVCELPGSAPFDLLLLYADGSTVWAQGDTAGNCANLAVQGGGIWGGSPELLAAARRLIADQRVELGSSATATPAQCPQSWNDVSHTAGAGAVHPGDEVSITACRYLLEQGDPLTITQSWAGTRVAQVAVDDPQRVLRLIAGGSRIDPCAGVAYDLDRTQDVLLIRDTYGDVQVVSTTPCWPNTLTGARLYPAEDLANLVAHLIGDSTG